MYVHIMISSSTLLYYILYIFYLHTPWSIYTFTSGGIYIYTYMRSYMYIYIQADIIIYNVFACVCEVINNSHTIASQYDATHATAALYPPLTLPPRLQTQGWENDAKQSSSKYVGGSIHSIQKQRDVEFDCNARKQRDLGCSLHYIGSHDHLQLCGIPFDSCRHGCRHVVTACKTTAARWGGEARQQPDDPVETDHQAY